MTVEQALQTQAFIEGLCDGSPLSIHHVRILTQALLADPERFWDSYFMVMNPDSVLEGGHLMNELGEDATHGDMQMFVQLEHKRLTQ